MNEKHSKYYNETPEEAVKKLRVHDIIGKTVSLGIVIAIIFIICHIFLQIEQYDFFREEQNQPLLVLILLLYIVIMLIILILYSKVVLPIIGRYNSLQLEGVLFMDCDPIKMYDIYNLWEQYDKKGKARNAFLLSKAQCCRFIPERMEEGMEYLSQVKLNKKQMHMESLRLLCVAAYARYKEDRAIFDKAKFEMEILCAKARGKAMKQDYNRILQFINMYELLWDEKDAQARKLINHLLLNHNETRINKVRFHMNLALLDRKEKDYESAKLNLEYVVKFGNKLGIVPEAKELLEICKKELEEQSN